MHDFSEVVNEFFQLPANEKEGSALMTRNKVADHPQASTIFRKRYTTGETTCDTNAILLRNTFSAGLKNLLNTGKHSFFLGLRCKQEFKAIAIVFQIILLFHLFDLQSCREVAGKYSVEVRKLSLLLLDLICEGLGLESGYFNGNGLKPSPIDEH